MASGGGDQFKVLTVVDIRHKMDALVSDLSQALDESQHSQYHKKRRGFKRRVKIPSISHSTNRSGDSSSSIGEVLSLSQDNKSSIPLSDSDDMSPPPEPRLRTQLLTHHRCPNQIVESDSVNENFSPSRSHNRSRKRKCKRIALDPERPEHLKTLAVTPSSSISSSVRRKKLLRVSPDTDVRHIGVSVGKRKRGRERSVEWCCHHIGTRKSTSSHYNHSHHHNHNHHHHHHHHHRRHQQEAKQQKQTSATDDCMDCHYSDDPNMDHSSDGSSSSESDGASGIYTCDEGREADDEHSDWFAEGPDGAQTSNARPRNISNHRMSWWNDSELGLSTSAKALFKERYETMSLENQQACRLRFQKLRERLLRREIRAGRRRIRDRKEGFSIVSSVNDKVSRFMQDPTQSELRLKPMTDVDRDQLNHLADLYSLSVRSEDDVTAPILTKTGKTITKQFLEGIDGEQQLACGTFPGGLPVPLSDLKRRRRTPPPHTSNPLTEGSNDSNESSMNPGTSGLSCRPPVPLASWDDEFGDCCADSLSERLADSEPDPLPSPTSLGLHDCTL